MHKEIISSCENENLRIFEGRVLSLLGDISTKLDQILFFCGPQDDLENNRDSMEEQDTGEWDDG